MTDSVQVAVTIIAALSLICTGVGAAYLGIVLRSREGDIAKAKEDKEKLYGHIEQIEQNLHRLELSLGNKFLTQADFAREIEAALSKWTVSADDRFVQKADLDRLGDHIAMKVASGYVTQKACESQRKVCPGSNGRGPKGGVATGG